MKTLMKVTFFVSVCSTVRFSTVVLLSILLLFSCSENSLSMNKADGIVYLGEIINVEPAGPLKTGFSDTIEFKVSLRNEDESPIADAPVDISFVSHSYNAQVSPTQFVTDSEGTGSVLFTAPRPAKEGEFSFDIRFRSANTETFVTINVDPAEISLTFEADYEGIREIEKLNAVLYEIDKESLSRIKIAEVDVEASMPYAFYFPGLLRNSTYDAEIRGKNSSGELRAAGFSTEIIPNTKGLKIVLEDTQLNLLGKYSSSLLISTNNALDWAVNSLFIGSSFFSNPSGAILDGIQSRLSSDPFAVDTYVQQRALNDWDGALSRYFQNKKIDIPEDFRAISQFLLDSLEHIAAEGTIEMGRDELGENIAYHKIERMIFMPEQDLLGPVYLSSIPNTAVFNVTYKPDDVLALDKHTVDFGLGDPIALLLSNASADILGSSDLTRAVQSKLDCSSVAAFLETMMSDSVLRATIESACLSVIDDAKDKTDSQIAILNLTNRLSVSKTDCSVIIPKTGSQISGFEAEELFVTWKKEQSTAESMPATLVAVSNLEL